MTTTTGKAYGDRPAMPLGREMSDGIDNFMVVLAD